MYAWVHLSVRTRTPPFKGVYACTVYGILKNIKHKKTRFVIIVSGCDKPNFQVIKQNRI